MAKPILIVRIDYKYFFNDQRERIISEIKKLGIYDEYYVFVTSVGAPEENFSFEVHGAGINTSCTVKGHDLLINYTRATKS